jgi:hypothetical protein
MKTRFVALYGQDPISWASVLGRGLGSHEFCEKSEIWRFWVFTHAFKDSSIGLQLSGERRYQKPHTGFGFPLKF